MKYKDFFDTEMNEEIIKRGSQSREKIEDTDYDIVDRPNDDEVILKDRVTGQYELWSKNNDFSGYVVEINAIGYEFVRSSDDPNKLNEAFAESQYCPTCNRKKDMCICRPKPCQCDSSESPCNCDDSCPCGCQTGDIGEAIKNKKIFVAFYLDGDVVNKKDYDSKEKAEAAMKKWIKDHANYDGYVHAEIKLDEIHAMDGHTMDWDYVNYKDGKLWTDDMELYCDETFQSVEEAEEYLKDNDIRATIREAAEIPENTNESIISFLNSNGIPAREGVKSYTGLARIEVPQQYLEEANKLLVNSGITQTDNHKRSLMWISEVKKTGGLIIGKKKV